MTAADVQTRALKVTMLGAIEWGIQRAIHVQKGFIAFSTGV